MELQPGNPEHGQTLVMVQIYINSSHGLDLDELQTKSRQVFCDIDQFWRNSRFSQKMVRIYTWELKQEVWLGQVKLGQVKLGQVKLGQIKLGQIT